MHRNKLIDIPLNEDEEALLSNWIYEQNTKTNKGDIILAAETSLQNKKSKTFRTTVNIKEKFIHNCVIKTINSYLSIECLKDGREYLLVYEALNKLRHQNFINSFYLFDILFLFFQLI